MIEFSIKNSSSQLSKPDKEGRQQFGHKPNRLSLPIALSNNQAYTSKRMERLFVKTEFG
jgi:hypothetical protein